MTTYETALAAAQKEGRAWPCSCGAQNPPNYDACHDCQRPSWTCADCNTVNSTATNPCRQCGGSTVAELLYENEDEDTDWIARQIGPQQVGGRYYSGYWGLEYEVLAIDDKPDSWGAWEMDVRWDDGREISHCTPWEEGRDRVISQPPAPDVTVVSIGRLHDGEQSEYADVLEHATVAIDLRRHFRDPHIRADLRELTANDKVVVDTVMDTPGVREVLAATALLVLGFLAGPTKAPLTLVTQCAGGRHRAAVTAMALHAVLSGDVEEAAVYGLADAAQAFADRGLVVHLVHRDLDRPVVQR